MVQPSIQQKHLNKYRKNFPDTNRQTLSTYKQTAQNIQPKQRESQL